MEILIIISFTIVFFTAIITKKKIYHPIILFNGIWLIIFMLYKMQLIKFISISQRTILILMFMIIFFPVGVILSNLIFNKYQKTPNLKEEKYALRKKIFWFICIFSAIKLFSDEIGIMTRLLSGMSFQQIMAYFSGKSTVEIKGFSVFLYLFIIYPCVYFISPICSNVFFSKTNKNKYRYLIMNIIIVTLSVLHHGGRNSIFIFLISYGITYYMKNKRIKIKRKTKFGILIALFIAFFAISLISSSRGIEDMYLSFYSYFTCPIPLTELYLNMPAIKGLSLNGFLSFNGFIQTIIIFLNRFGFNNPQKFTMAQNVKVIIEENYLSIGNYALNMNAFIPVGTYLYIDGGYPFEIFGMILFGFISGIAFYNSYYKKNNKNDVLYVFICIGIVLSFIRFYFTSIYYVNALYYLLFLYKKERVIEK